MKANDLINESKKGVKAPKRVTKPRNYVAKNAMATTSGAGAHKDKKKASKQGQVKHKSSAIPMDEGQRDDPELKQTMRDAQRHYPGADEKGAFNKFVQRSLKHSKEDDKKLKNQVNKLAQKVGKMNIKEAIEEAMYRRPGSPTAYDRDYASSVSGMGKHDSLAYQLDGGANDEGWDEPRGKYQAPEDKPVLKGYYFYNVPAGMEDQAAIYGVKQTKNGKWAKALYSTSGRSFAMQKDGADKAFGPGRWWSPK